MATLASFDISTGADLQEVDNAVNQATKEVAQRYDFKGSKASLTFDRLKATLVLVADDDFKMKALFDVLQSKLIKRGVPVVSCAKGLSPDGKLMTEVMAELIPDAVPAVLSGPTFASEAARGLPTAATLASTPAGHAVAEDFRVTDGMEPVIILRLKQSGGTA